MTPTTPTPLSEQQLNEIRKIPSAIRTGSEGLKFMREKGDEYWGVVGLLPDSCVKSIQSAPAIIEQLLATISHLQAQLAAGTASPANPAQPVQIDPENSKTWPIEDPQSAWERSSVRVLVGQYDTSFGFWRFGYSRYDLALKCWICGGTWTHWSPLPDWSATPESAAEAGESDG